jgi:hypothetical protein
MEMRKGPHAQADPLDQIGLAPGQIKRTGLDTLRWHDAYQLFGPAARVRVRQQRRHGRDLKPISTKAYLDRQSGKIYWHSEFGEDDEESPDDIDDEIYVSIPDTKRARSRYDEVRQIFS